MIHLLNMVIVQLTMLVYQRVLCLFFIYWQRNCPGEKKNKCHCIAVADHLSYCWQQERRTTQHLSWVKHQEAIKEMFHQAEMIPRFMGYSYSNPKHGDVIPRKHLPWTLRNWLDIMARIEPIQWADNKPANIHTYIYIHIKWYYIYMYCYI